MSSLAASARNGPFAPPRSPARTVDFQLPTASRGFTIIELLIVTAVIAILAAIIVSYMIEARKGGNEGAAIAALKAIASAQTIFRERDSEGDDASDFATLGELGAEEFIDPVLASGTKQGYLFAISSPADIATWSCNASPQIPGTSGDRYFFVDQSNVIRRSDAGPADSTSQIQ